MAPCLLVTQSPLGGCSEKKRHTAAAGSISIIFILAEGRRGHSESFCSELRVPRASCSSCRWLIAQPTFREVALRVEGCHGATPRRRNGLVAHKTKIRKNRIQVRKEVVEGKQDTFLFSVYISTPPVQPSPHLAPLFFLRYPNPSPLTWRHMWSSPGSSRRPRLWLQACAGRVHRRRQARRTPA